MSGVRHRLLDPPSLDIAQPLEAIPGLVALFDASHPDFLPVSQFTAVTDDFSGPAGPLDGHAASDGSTWNADPAIVLTGTGGITGTGYGFAQLPAPAATYRVQAVMRSGGAPGAVLHVRHADENNETRFGNFGGNYYMQDLNSDRNYDGQPIGVAPAPAVGDVLAMEVREDLIIGLVNDVPVFFNRTFARAGVHNVGVQFGGTGATSGEFSDFKILPPQLANQLNDIDLVRLLADRSGNGRHATFVNAGQVPAYRTGETVNLIQPSDVPEKDYTDSIRTDTAQSGSMRVGTPYFAGFSINSAGLPNDSVRLDAGVESWGGYGYGGNVTTQGAGGGGLVPAPPKPAPPTKIDVTGRVNHPDYPRVTMYRFLGHADGSGLSSANGEHVYITKPYVIPVKHQPGGRGNPRNVQPFAETPQSGGLGSWTVTNGNATLESVSDPRGSGRHVFKATANNGNPYVDQAVGAIKGIVPGRHYIQYIEDERVNNGGSNNFTTIWRDASGNEVGRIAGGDFMSGGSAAGIAPPGAVAADQHLSLNSDMPNGSYYIVRSIGLYEAPTFAEPNPEPYPTPAIRSDFATLRSGPLPLMDGGYTFIGLVRPRDVPGWGAGRWIFTAGSSGNQYFFLGMGDGSARGTVADFQQQGATAQNPHTAPGVRSMQPNEWAVLILSWDQTSGRVVVHKNDDVYTTFLQGSMSPDWALGGVDLGGFDGDIAAFAIVDRPMPVYECRQVIHKLLERVK